MKATLLIITAFFYHITCGQALLELSLTGQQHINTSEMVNSDRSLSDQGNSVGIRFGVLEKKNLYHFSALYSRLNNGYPAVSVSEMTSASNMPERQFLRLQLVYRRNFRVEKRVYPYAGIGLTGFLFDRQREYSSVASPLWPSNKKTGKDRLSLLISPGIRCRVNSKLSADLETGLNYFFLQQTEIRENFALYFGVSMNLVIRHRTHYGSEPGYNPTNE